MITTLNLNRHRQARIWLGELPYLIPSSKNNATNFRIDNCSIDNSRESVCHVLAGAKLFEIGISYPDFSFSLISDPPFTPGQRRAAAAVEMIIPSAGRALYGLLGAKFVSDRSGELLVKLAVSENVEAEIDWSLASSIDKVCAGLPVEYADSVLDGVIHSGKILGSGVLFFNCAAHGEIGSSPQMFRQLALRVVRLIASASMRKSFSEEELAELLSADETDRSVHQVPITNYVSSLNRMGLQKLTLGLQNVHFIKPHGVAKEKLFSPDKFTELPWPMGHDVLHKGKLK